MKAKLSCYKEVLDFHSPHSPGQNKLKIHLAAFPSNGFVTPENYSRKSRISVSAILSSVEPLEWSVWESPPPHLSLDCP